MQFYREKLPLPVWFSGLRFNAGLTIPLGRSAWIGVTMAVTLVLAVIGLIAHTWAAIGDATISKAGWVAIAFGVVVTLGLGTGLMSLVFTSNREGFDDEAVGVTRIAAESAPTGKSAGAGSKIEAG